MLGLARRARKFSITGKQPRKEGMINMNQPIEFKAAISSITKPTSQSSVVSRCGIIALLLVCFGLLPMNAFGVVPAPDGGYPGGNTAEGQAALLNLTSG